MNHYHRIHMVGGAWFQVPCGFAKDASSAMKTGLPITIEGFREHKHRRRHIILATRKIVAVEKDCDGAQIEDSCSYNK